MHPSMVSLSRPAVQRVRGYGHSRFVAVAVALLVPAAVVAVRPPASAVERVVTAGLMCSLGVLVLMRTAGAVNRHATSEMRHEQLANYDSLTGLPNRLHLVTHIEQVLARAHNNARGVAVLFMDLDQFKLVNDTWGHQTGDELLTVVADRLASRVRQGELAARIGGDEFVVVCENVDRDEDAVAVAQRVLVVFESPVNLPSADVTINASVGVAFAEPCRQAVTAEDLLREADTAMYRAKAREGSRPVFFDESMRIEAAARIAVESSLRGALERHELEMYYQPIVNLRSGATTGFEALMRWRHPELGMVPPADIISVAESAGLVVKLGRWAVEETIHQLCEWHRNFGVILTMSVNFSPRQLRDPELVDTVARMLADTGLPGSALCLEVTESSLMEDVESTRAAIAALKRLGVRLSADDFGTGYSSLAYLRMFPFDEVKIDRSFVTGLGRGGEDDVIVGAVVSMAKVLSLTTVAEGVETAAQRDRLLALGADCGQGWLFSAPLAPDDAAQHVGRHISASQTRLRPGPDGSRTRATFGEEARMDSGDNRIDVPQALM